MGGAGLMMKQLEEETLKDKEADLEAESQEGSKGVNTEDCCRAQIPVIEK
jgi:hypothetical protein